MNDLKLLKKSENKDQTNSFDQAVRNVVSLEAFVFMTALLIFFSVVAMKMGSINMLNTIMNTANSLLIDTVFYILAIAVLTGGLSGLLSEFGVVSLINKLLSPIIKPIYDLPGASTIGILTCYMSDNPAILTLAEDIGFRRYFKKYQLPALTNIGTSFGMGLIISSFIISIPSPTGERFLIPVLVGTLGAIIGSIISTRIMLMFTKKQYDKNEDCVVEVESENHINSGQRIIRKGNIGTRFIEAMLAGGKIGVEMGLAIIPGVLIICTLVLILTNGPSQTGEYTGAAYEGISLLPWIGAKFEFILSPLFGFSSPEAIAVPITSLGAAGAAIGLIPRMVNTGLAQAGDIAVFTAMCMCWSGYLSTHVAMMDTLKCSHLTGKAILSHTIGGIFAGISANWIFKLITLLF